MNKITSKRQFSVLIAIILAILMISGSAFAVQLAPEPLFQPVDATGIPYEAGELFTYESGTSTPLATYDKDGNANDNPTIMDSAGRADIYLTENVEYRFVFKNAAGDTIYTRDNIKSIQDVLSADSTFLVEHNPDGTHDIDISGDTFNYPDATAADQGVTGASNTIKYYQDTIGSTNKATIYLKHDSGSEFTDYRFQTNFTSTTNITFELEPGARFDPDSGKTLTVNSSAHIISGLMQQIKTGDGTLAFTIKTGFMYPEQFGNVDGVNDDEQINEALATGVPIIVLAGPTVYELAEHIEIEADKQKLIGVGWPTLRTAVSTSNGVVILIENKADIEITGLIIDGNSKTLHGIDARGGGNQRLYYHRNQIKDTLQYAIVLQDDTLDSGGFDDARILWNIITGIGDDGIHSASPFSSVAIEVFPRHGALSYSNTIEIAHNRLHSMQVSLTAGIKVQIYTKANIHDNTIDLTGVTTNTAGIEAPSNTNVFIHHNEIINANAAISVPGGPHPVDGGQFITFASVTDNIVTDSARIVFSSGGFGATYVITGNIGSGITSNGIDFDTNAGVWETGYGDITIDDNISHGAVSGIGLADTAADGYGAVVISNNTVGGAISTVVDNIIIEGNFIDSPPGNGIRAQGDDSKIIDNTIWQPNQNNSSAAILRAGIYVNNAARPQLRGNTIDNGSTGNAEYAFEFHTVTSPKIGKNYIRGMDVSDYKFTAVTGWFPDLPDDATPSLADGNSDTWKTGTGRGTATITNIDGAYIGQIITIYAEEAFTVDVDAGFIFLDGATDFVMGNTDTLTIKFMDNSKWYELSRSVN